LSKVKKLLEANETIACLLTESINNIGNSTKLILNNGQTIIIHKSISSVLKEIAEFYALDLKILRKKQQIYTHSKYYVPLPLSKNLLLIPIKTKVPLVPKDPSLSYINYYSIKEIDKYNPIVYLSNGVKIKCLNSLDTLKKRYNQGQICHKLMDVSNKYMDYSHLRPATRGDLEKLREEMLLYQQELIKKLIEGKFTDIK